MGVASSAEDTVLAYDAEYHLACGETNAAHNNGDAALASLNYMPNTDFDAFLNGPAGPQARSANPLVGHDIGPDETALVCP